MRANKHLLLWSSLATLAVLLWAAVDENLLSDWRRAQLTARERMAAADAERFDVQLRQIVAPQLKAMDRCVSCHVGMAPGETGVAGDPAFGPHPKVVHDPASFGCTACHAGQGRATTLADAHGQVPHWPSPMIPRRYAAAGCGSCHTHLAVPDVEELARGRDLFEQHDCLACHRVDDRGGTLRPGGQGGQEGPDLSVVGARGVPAAWYAGHLQRHQEATQGPWRSAVGEIPDDERLAIDAYLTSRVGAPGLVEAKAVFNSLGCRGCHQVNGVGGDDGPSLSRAGERDPGQTRFDGVRGERTLSNWFKEHFRAPGRVVPGSLMPELGLDETQLEQLTLYLFSLRESSAQGQWPTDRVRALRLGEREFAADGATIYGTFCAACHGPRGEGMRFPGMAAFPAVANPDFLAVASDAFLVDTVRHGRPGRRMPAWAALEGGLREPEIAAVVEHLRTLGGGVRPGPDARPARFAQGSIDDGRALYGRHCAGCHGADALGAEGPSLGNPRLLATASDGYLVDTIARGRGHTAMPSFSAGSPVTGSLTPDEIEAVVAFLRSLEKKS